MDQALFLAMRATGRRAVVQSVWVYDDAIDLDGLERFHHNLCYGLLGRRIECSPLPFGRHRWVACQGPDIDIAEYSRPRSELSDWADERAQLPVDPESGPGWHLGVLPLTDGSTAVSLVVSHCLVDGLGVSGAIADAVTGKRRDLGYPPPGSRTRLRALAQDLRQTARGAPEIVRALVAAARDGRHRQRNGNESAASQRIPVQDSDDSQPVVVPMITVHVGADDWDARAKALGGMNHHLLAGFAAKLGEHMGRRHSRHGLVTLQLPISDRTEGDARANALSFVSIDVDPAPVTTDLRNIRVALGQAFRAQREAPEGAAQLGALAPLVSFVPKRLLKRFVDAAFAYNDLPVGCSNAGDVDPALGRPDGTDASQASARGGEQQVTREHLERTGGQLTVWAARFGGKVCVTVGAYQPGGANSKPALREQVTQTLREFDLAGVVD
ncbi:wax ester/triacylglycerol synthase domain-containing protein [Mycobacterium sp.]|uniref:wax ester/triacylglycerol synthase domain-containing protein n=1 Tax=Mycobacterium sp. TaxID=1785 RepID=UPI003D6BB2A7